MPRKVTITKRATDGKASEFLLDDGTDPMERDMRLAQMIGQVVAQAVSQVVSQAMNETMERMDAMIEMRRQEDEARREEERSRPIEITVADEAAYDLARKKKRDADWDARIAKWDEMAADMKARWGTPGILDGMQQ